MRTCAHVSAHAPSCCCCCRPQGALRKFKSKHGNGFTRNYAGLWLRLLEVNGYAGTADNGGAGAGGRGGGGAVAAQQGAAAVRLVVVGKGLKKDLELPEQLEQHVDFHPWLRYPVRGAEGSRGPRGGRAAGTRAAA